MNKWMLLVPLALIACGDKIDDTAGDDSTADPKKDLGRWVTLNSQSIHVVLTRVERTILSSQLTSRRMTMAPRDADWWRPEFLLFIEWCRSHLWTVWNDRGGTRFRFDSDSNLYYWRGITSNTSFDGTVNMSTTCEGEDCSMFETQGMTLPCSMEGTFTTTAG